MKNFAESQRKIEAYREQLKARGGMVRVIDYGAGSPDSSRSKEEMNAGVEVEVELLNLAATGIKDARAQRIFEVLCAQNPSIVLELGTCCGFSSAYLSHAAPNAKIYTIEGAPRIAEIAQETRRNLGVNNVVQKVGRFSDVLPELLPQIAPLDFVFIDGHHDRDATIGYFRQILPFMNKRGIMVFDDITWSEGMKEAWAQILAFGAHKRESSDGKIGVLWL
ncbi:MAG: O-methyltransferase [Wolinella sp.]